MMSNRGLWLALVLVGCGMFVWHELNPVKVIPQPSISETITEKTFVLKNDSDITLLSDSNRKKKTKKTLENKDTSIPRGVLHGNQVEFEVVDGVAVAFGDMILGRVEEGSSIQKGIYEVPKSHIWEKPEIPYLISPELPHPERVEKAIEYLRQNTKLQFVPYERQFDAIIFESGTKHCYSYLGKIGGLQPIKLSTECENQQILHEIMHVLGFIHEQSRPDRDQYVEVLWSHVQDEFKHQFNIVPESLFETEKDSAFDFHSIMLYRPNAFSIRPDLNTLQSRRTEQVEPVLEGLSSGDLARIANLYRF